MNALVDNLGQHPRVLVFLDGIRVGAALWDLFSQCLIWGGGNVDLQPETKIAVEIFMVVFGWLMFYISYQRGFVEPLGSWVSTRLILPAGNLAQAADRMLELSRQPEQLRSTCEAARASVQDHPQCWHNARPLFALFHQVREIRPGKSLTPA